MIVFTFRAVVSNDESHMWGRWRGRGKDVLHASPQLLFLTSPSPGRGHRLRRGTAKQTLCRNAGRQRAKLTTFRHFPSKEQVLLVEWNVDRPNSVTTVGTGQLVPSSIPQTVTPPPTRLGIALRQWAASVSLPRAVFLPS